MTTTEEYIGTGSLMTSQGLRPGMAHSIRDGHLAGSITPNLIIVNYDPSGVLPNTTGSDIAYVTTTGSFCIGDIVNGVGGLGWHALQTV